MMPIPKPISLLGQISPLKYAAKYSIDFMNAQLIGTETASVGMGYFSYQPYFTFPCN
jgi:hypothetical protein